MSISSTKTVKIELMDDLQVGHWSYLSLRSDDDRQPMRYYDPLSGVDFAPLIV